MRNSAQTRYLLGKRAGAAVMAVVLAVSLVPLPPYASVERAWAGSLVFAQAESLDVTFDESTGVAGWVGVEGATAHWFECNDKLGGDDRSGHVTANFAKETETPGTYTVDFKKQLDDAVTSGRVQQASTYEIKVYDTDAEANILAEWSADFAYTPTIAELPEIEGVNLDSSTGDLTWTAYAGAEQYTLFFNGKDAISTEETSVNLKEEIDKAITYGRIEAASDGNYTVAITALDLGGLAIAKSTVPGYFSHASSATAADPADAAALDVTFDTVTGKATWNAFPQAKTYWCAVDGKSTPTEDTTFNFATQIDTLWKESQLAKKDSYAISVSAYNEDGQLLLAEWKTTYEHTPSASIAGASLDENTGILTWDAFAGATSYTYGVNGIYRPAEGTSVDIMAAIDGMYLEGLVEKGDFYQIDVFAYAESTTDPIATWSMSVLYSPNPAMSKAIAATIADQAYTGKAKKPKPKLTMGTTALVNGVHYKLSYKNNKKMGKATVTVTGIGRVSGTMKLTFNIVPKAPTCKKPEAGSKSIKVTWKAKTKKVTGYQVQYSTGKNFKTSKKKLVKGANKNTLELKKLKAKKKYRVQVRAYKTIKGKKYYSAWSKAYVVRTR